MQDSGDDFETTGRPAAGGRSLKARAVALLSRREHSRRELERKLAPYASDHDALQATLDDLQRENWQSDERFAQAVVHRRAARHGHQRIAQELRQHGIADQQIAAIESELRDTELERAQAVWSRKYTERPADTREYARQYRFMVSRGFSADCVRRILGDLPT